LVNVSVLCKLSERGMERPICQVSGIFFLHKDTESLRDLRVSFVENLVEIS